MLNVNLINRVVELQKTIMNSKWDTYREKFEIEQIVKGLTDDEYIELRKIVEEIVLK